MAKPKARLAVIGTGIAGLSAAYLLKQKYDVTVYEAQKRAGMGVHTIDYTSNGRTSRIDIPLRIFCRGYYDHLMALYKHIGVDIVASDHSGIFVNDSGRVLLHYGNMHIGATSRSYLKADSLFAPRAWNIGLQAQSFFSRAKRDFRHRRDKIAGQSFREYLEESNAGRPFVDQILMPILSVTCTCDYQAIRDYPADLILEYLTSGIFEYGILSAEKGVDDIVPRLLEGVALKADTAVETIEKHARKIRVGTKAGEQANYDHVVVAAQAQQAAGMLSGFDREQALLRTVPVEKSTMSVHTDTNLLHRGGSDTQSPVSYYVPADAKRAEVTVNLTATVKRLEKQKTVFQTWNPIRQPGGNRELARVDFTRPTVTLESRDAMAELRELQSKKGNRLWFTGSYMANKIPLLDAAVDSSVKIAEHLGAEAPWETGG